MLEIIDYHKSYGDKEVVKGINIKIENGEIFGFIGHNGAGKSTTIKSIVGISGFEKGKILINGHDILKEPLLCKRQLAYIPDEPNVYENLKGIEYLKFIASVFNINKDIFINKVEEYSKVFEIYDVLNNHIREYSHGMKQKLVIISALIHDPELLVLDEPFVGLDPASSFHLQFYQQKL